MVFSFLVLWLKGEPAPRFFKKGGKIQKQVYGNECTDQEGDLSQYAYLSESIKSQRFCFR